MAFGLLAEYFSAIVFIWSTGFGPTNQTLFMNKKILKLHAPSMWFKPWNPTAHTAEMKVNM